MWLPEGLHVAMEFPEAVFHHGESYLGLKLWETRDDHHFSITLPDELIVQFSLFRPQCHIPQQHSRKTVPLL